MTVTAPHQDKPFSHAPHIIGTVLTFGGWAGIWFWRLTLHKIDRNREALFEIAQAIESQSLRDRTREERDD